MPSPKERIIRKIELPNFSHTNILIINYLWAAFEHMATRTQTFATAIANVCNRDCKRLQSGVYTIIWRVGYGSVGIKMAIKGCTQTVCWLIFGGQKSPKRTVWKEEFMFSNTQKRDFSALIRHNVQWFYVYGMQNVQKTKWHYVSTLGCLQTNCHFLLTPSMRPN